jgi:hypothetical protein
MKEDYSILIIPRRSSDMLLFDFGYNNDFVFLILRTPDDKSFLFCGVLEGCVRDDELKNGNNPEANRQLERQKLEGRRPIWTIV